MDEIDLFVFRKLLYNYVYGMPSSGA